MKKTIIKKYAACAALAATLALLPASCIKDDTAPGTKETTLTLTVSTRGDDPAQTDNGGKELEGNEEMKTLRVIVARSSNHEIIYNEFEDEIADDDFQRTFDFQDLTIETDGEDFDFYAIANEESLDLSASGITTLEGKNVNLEALKNAVLYLDRNDFNEAGLGNIPQTAFAKVTVVPDESDNLTMQLQFVVAKITVTFTNQTGNPLYVDRLAIAGIKPDKGYLFDPNDIDDPTVVVPAGTTLANVDGSERIFVDTTTPKTVKAYVYPVKKEGTDAFALTAEGYPPLELTRADGTAITSLDRSEWLRININLILKATDVKPDIEWEVLDWGTKEIEVPEFD